MPTTTYEIDRYKIIHLDAAHYEQTARIECYKSPRFKGTLWFYRDGVTIPLSFKDSDGRLNLNFKEHEFRDIVETLRLEKPLYISFRDEGSLGKIKTTYKEPIGEEES